MVDLNFTAGVSGPDFVQDECEGSGFSIAFTDLNNGNVTFDENNPSGNVTLLSSAGCDSTFMVDLNFTEGVSGQDFLQEECAGEGFSISFTDVDNGNVTFNEGNPMGMVTLISSAGCDSTFMVDLTFNPTTTNFVNMDLCTGDPFELEVGALTFDESNPQGEVVLANMNANGCDSIVAVNLNYSNVTFELIADESNICSGDEVNFTLNFNSDESTDIEIQNNAGEVINFQNVSDGFTFSLSFDGNDQISLLSAIDIECADLANANVVDVNVSELSAELIPELFNSFNTTCFGENDGSIEISFENMGIGELTYLWSTGSTDQNLNMLEAGFYEVTITDEVGCQNIVSTNLNSPDLIEVDFDVFGVPCEEAGLGSIVVNNVVGGTGEYAFNLNDEIVPLSPGQTSATFDELTGGAYVLNITDSNNCESEFMIELESSSDLFLESIGNVSIALGEDFQVILQSSFDIDSIVWTPSEGLSCFDCENPIATPSKSTTYEVTAWDENGCSVTETLSIVVRKSESPYYIPSAFSPNGDGINDEFYIFSGNEVTQVQKLAIFDRWGTQLFVNENFQTNQFNEGWDGSFRNKKLQAGVYVFYAVIELRNGETVFEEGNISLVK